MSLATRCPACQTVFRVVQDQLRVSEGWVRCGRCAEVFNALEHMVEVVKPAAAASPPHPAPSAYSPPPPVPPPAVRLPAGTPDLSDEPALRQEPAVPPMRFAPLPDPADAFPPEPALPEGVVAAHEELYEPPFEETPAEARGRPVDAEDDEPAGHDHAASASTAADEGPEALSAAALLELRPGGPDGPDGPGDPDAPLAAERDAASTLPASTSPLLDSIDTLTPPPAADAANESAVLPGFMRRAQRAERWQRPAVRRTLAALVVLGLAGLVLQLGLAYRDLLAARWPETRTVLAPLCEALGCRIEQPRWIDAVVVDSTGLTKIEGNAYRLSVVMRNRSTLALALPAVDLMLTDTQGRLVARRTLSARELGASVPALPAQGELTLQATLQVAAATVAGYTIELFYP